MSRVARRGPEPGSYVAGIVGAVLLVVLAVAAAAYFCFRRHRRMSPKKTPPLLSDKRPARSKSARTIWVENNATRLFKDRPYQRPITQAQLLTFQPLKEVLLQDRSMAIVTAMSRACPHPEAERLAKSLAYVFLSEGRGLDLVSSMCTLEIEASNNPSTLFRIDSCASKVFSHYARIECAQYLSETLRPVVQQVQDIDVEVSSDLFGLSATHPDPALLERVLSFSQTIFDRLRTSARDIPPPMRVLLRRMRDTVAKRFPGSENQAVGGFLFLRLINPALSSAQVYNLFAEGKPTDKAQRVLIYVSKLLQHLANNTIPSKKDPRLTSFDVFVESNRQRILDWYSEMLEVDETIIETEPPLQLPDEIVDSGIAFLQQFISMYGKDFKRALEEIEGPDGPSMKSISI